MRSSAIWAFLGLAACAGKGGGGGGGSDPVDSGGPDTGEETPAPGHLAISGAEALDFGEVPLGCAAEASITLRNDGGTSLAFESAAIAGDASFSFLDTPYELGPQESKEIPFLYEPGTLAAHTATFDLVLSEGEAVSLPLQGRGVSGGSQSDAFAGGKRPVDILFAVDQSYSMDLPIELLAYAWPAFAAALDARGLDWQAAVVVEDDGCVSGGLLTPGMDHAAAFESAVTTRAEGLSYVNALLTLARLAVDQSGAGECNEGLLRPDADLHVITLSGEPEQSESGWAALVPQIILAVGDPERVRISAIAGDYPAGCYLDGDFKDAGEGYYEAVSSTGGYFFSICSWDYASGLELLAAGAEAALRTFPLSDQPIEGAAIAVSVDGVEQSGGWEYDDSENAVIFDDAPPDGAAIEITYEVYGSCE